MLGIALAVKVPIPDTAARIVKDEFAAFTHTAPEVNWMPPAVVFTVPLLVTVVAAPFTIKFPDLLIVVPAAMEVVTLKFQLLVVTKVPVPLIVLGFVLKLISPAPASVPLFVKDIDQTTFDLSVKNPANGGEVILREPKDILGEITKLDQESAKLLKSISEKI